jgi:hypothetical protein
MRPIVLECHVPPLERAVPLIAHEVLCGADSTPSKPYANQQRAE